MEGDEQAAPEANPEPTPEPEPKPQPEPQPGPTSTPEPEPEGDTAAPWHEAAERADAGDLDSLQHAAAASRIAAGAQQASDRLHDLMDEAQSAAQRARAVSAPDDPEQIEAQLAGAGSPFVEAGADSGSTPDDEPGSEAGADSPSRESSGADSHSGTDSHSGSGSDSGTARPESPGDSPDEP